VGVAVACEDEAGPYQTVPYAAPQWAPVGHPPPQPHEYVRLGTAKLLTLLRPATGRVWAQGVTACPHRVLHPWLQTAVNALLAELPAPEPVTDPVANRAGWTRWQEGLRVRITLPDELPRLRLLLIWDNLTGHHTPALLLWLFAQGVMVLYTPLSGSWLNMAESLQRILVRRALAGQHPQTSQDIIDALEATAHAWNADPTPFIWGGRRAARRVRARQRRQALGGSGAGIARSFRCRSHGYLRRN
jgi:DDE superfamily endonuclease